MTITTKQEAINRIAALRIVRRTGTPAEAEAAYAATLALRQQFGIPPRTIGVRLTMGGAAKIAAAKKRATE